MPATPAPYKATSGDAFIVLLIATILAVIGTFSLHNFSDPAGAVVGVMTIGAFMVGTAVLAASKGRSGWWGLLGFFSFFGMLIVVLIPRKREFPTFDIGASVYVPASGPAKQAVHVEPQTSDSLPVAAARQNGSTWWKRTFSVLEILLFLAGLASGIGLYAADRTGNFPLWNVLWFLVPWLAVRILHACVTYIVEG